MRQVGLVTLTVLALAGAAVAQPLLSRSQAKAIVRDVNLKASDMAKYDAYVSDGGSAGDRRALGEIARCDGGVSPSRGLATGSSPVFLHGNGDNYEVFGSVVTVFPKAAMVSKDLRALRSVRGRECLRAALASGATATATTLRTSVSGVFGYRLKQEVASRPGTFGYLDYIFTGTRAGEATVVVGSYPSPPSQGLEDKVIRIVKTRLRARLDPDAIL